MHSLRQGKRDLNVTQQLIDLWSMFDGMGKVCVRRDQNSFFLYVAFSGCSKDGSFVRVDDQGRGQGYGLLQEFMHSRTGDLSTGDAINSLLYEC